MGFLGNNSAVYHRRGGKPRRRLALLYFVEIFICFALLGSFGYFFTDYVTTGSDRFFVKRVQVQGAYVLREEAILQAANIHENDNVLLMQCEAVRQRVLGIPYVQECNVQRMYPDTIVIKVEERVPLAVISLNNHLYEIDGEAMVLRELDHYSPELGPIISELPELPAVEIGKPLKNDTLKEVLELMMALRRVPIGQKLKPSEFTARAPNDITMYCEGVSFAFRWGRSDYLRQAQLLDVWWGQMGETSPCKEYLDLRFGDDLVCK